jgi:thiol:disulfide interchange protein DsbD
MGEGLAASLETAPLLALGLAFLGGLATSFTPCVYPIIPITVTFIGARGVQTRLQAFVLSLFYALGIAVTYTALGIFAALSGRIFGAMTQSPYVYLVVGNIILLFGLNMLEVFELPLPGVLSGTGTAKARKGFLGAFAIGVTSGFVVGPCTAPVLATILTYVATQGNLFMGGATLFLFAMGMCALIIVAGTFSGALSSLPKSGDWMVRIKKGFGWVMILLGEYFVFRAGALW